MNNDGRGCAWAMLLSLMLIVVVGIAVSMTGLPTWDGSLAWDTTATADRQTTERHRITEDNETERERIEADARTAAEWAMTWRILGVAAAVAGSVYAWSRRPHKPVPPQVVALLPHFPGHVAELIEGEGSIVEQATGYYYTATDAERLLETR